MRWRAVSNLAFLLCWLLISGCENPITSPGPQPSGIDDVVHQPMLNIFGVLRPGQKGGLPLSFIHVERSIPYAFSQASSTNITDAEVAIFFDDGTTGQDSVIFSVTDFDATFSAPAYRNANFQPEAERTYGIACRKPGFPILTAVTTVPRVPEIVDGTLSVSETEISLWLQRDPNTALYDVVLIIDGHEYAARVRRPESGDVRVAIPFAKGTSTSGKLIVYGYDLKMAAYLSYIANLKPQVYHLPYSTVEGGFGCFGSLNVLEMTVDLAAAN